MGSINIEHRIASPLLTPLIIWTLSQPFLLKLDFNILPVPISLLWSPALPRQSPLQRSSPYLWTFLCSSLDFANEYILLSVHFFSNKLVFNLTSFNLNTKIPYGQDNIALHFSVSEFLSLSDFVLKILTIWLQLWKFLTQFLFPHYFFVLSPKSWFDQMSRVVKMWCLSHGFK